MTTTSAVRWTADFVELEAADGRRLQGILHEPPGPARAALLLLHGKGANCYSGVCRFLPLLLARVGVRTLALNMRSHDLGYTRMDVPFVDLEDGHAAVDGGMWEDLDVGGLDVEAGIAFLMSEGAAGVVLCGHSSGGYYSALHDPQDRRVRGRVLLSPLVSNRRPLLSWFGGEVGLRCALDEARALVVAGAGERLIPTARWYYAISARALEQRAAEPHDVFVTALAATRSPILLGWGSLEGRGPQWAEIAAGLPGATTAVFDGAEHHYLGCQDYVARSIFEFLKTLT